MIAVVSGTAGIDMLGDSGDLDGAIALHDDVVEVIGSMWENTNFQARVRMSGLLLGQLASHVGKVGSADRPALIRQGDGLLAVAEETFASHLRRKRLTGLEGQAWIAAGPSRACAAAVAGRHRAADRGRAGRVLDGDGRAVFESFGHAFETARSQSRAAAALKLAGRPAEAKPLTDAATDDGASARSRAPAARAACRRRRSGARQRRIGR